MITRILLAALISSSCCLGQVVVYSDGRTVQLHAGELVRVPAGAVIEYRGRAAQTRVVTEVRVRVGEKIILPGVHSTPHAITRPSRAQQASQAAPLHQSTDRGSNFTPAHPLTPQGAASEACPAGTERVRTSYGSYCNTSVFRQSSSDDASAPKPTTSNSRDLGTQPLTTPMVSTITSGDEYEFVQSTFERLRRNSDLPSFRWVLVNVEQMNSSSALQARLVLVYQPMVRMLRGDQGEMAFLLAHELGHIADGACYNYASLPHSVGLGDGALPYKTIKPGAAIFSGPGLWPQPISKQNCEARADIYGLKYLVGAGFNPYDAAAWAGRMMMYGGDAGLKGFFMRFSSTHPIDSTRITNLRRLVTYACIQSESSNLFCPQ